jgi:hypothetical protein
VDTPFSDSQHANTCIAVSDAMTVRDQEIVNPRCDRAQDASFDSATPPEDAADSALGADGEPLLDAQAEASATGRGVK